jgi:hypothetical protein
VEIHTTTAVFPVARRLAPAAGADRVVASLEEVTIADIDALVEG